MIAFPIARSALARRFSPREMEMSDPAPTPTSRSKEITSIIKGKTTLIAPMPAAPTVCPTKSRSTML